MTGHDPAVLCVHTDERPARQLRDVDLRAERVHTTDVAVDELDRGEYDCVLLGDPSTGHRRDSLDRIATAAPNSPVLLYGLSDDLQRTLDAGAVDVVRVDSRAPVLVTRVNNVVDQTRDDDRERDELLDALLEHSPDQLSVLDSDGRYRFVSRAVERRLGHDSAEMVGRSAFEYVHPADRDRVQEVFESIRVAPGETHTAEYRLRTADGDWRWLESRGTNHLDDPTIEGIVINSRDVTERRQQNEQLREERALTEAIFEALPDVFYAFDENVNFLRWNDRLSTVTGYDDEEIESMHPAEFVLKEDRQEILDAIARIIESDEAVTVEARFEVKNGEVFPYEFTGARMTDDTGDPLGIVGIGRDIADRKQRQRRFEAVFNNTYQFTGLTDPDGTVVEVNETALEFGGLDRETVLGQPVWESLFFQHTETVPETVRTAVERARRGELFRTELEVQGNNGLETIDFSVRPLTDEHGDVRLLIVEGRTITALKQREQHLGVLQRLLRHNLRNKMSVIRGNADLLAHELAGTDSIEPVEKIQTAVDELVGLSDTAHKLSQVVTESTSEHRPVDVEQLLRSACTEFDEAYPEASLRLSVATQQQVRADWRLRVVFEQLIENALKHTGEPPAVEITATADEDSVSVRVADDGPGVPADELVGIVGERDRTQLTHGSGLGLWLVRLVLDDYGGDLSYESPPEYGSVFTVTLQTGVDGQLRPETGPAEQT